MIWKVYVLRNRKPIDAKTCRNREEARKTAKRFSSSIKTKKHSGMDIRMRKLLAAHLEAKAHVKPGSGRKQNQMLLPFMVTTAIEQAEAAMRKAAEEHKVDWRAKHWASYPVGRRAA